MIPNAARAGMGRLVASLIGLSLLLVMPALAGDRAQIDLIGYSDDGSYFAFEEFGIQDGSGFAYSSIYVVDLVDDSWVVGTPIRASGRGRDCAADAKFAPRRGQGAPIILSRWALMCPPSSWPWLATACPTMTPRP